MNDREYKVMTASGEKEFKSRYEIMEMTRWEKTLSHFPKMAAAGYIFITNIYKTDNVKPEDRVPDNHKLYIQGEYYIVTKIIVGSHLLGRHDSGKIDHKLIPLFGKLKAI